MSASTSPEITARGYELVFRTIGLDSMQGPVAGNYIASQSPERVAIVHDKQQYGEGIATAVRDTLQDAGIEIAMFEALPPVTRTSLPSSPKSNRPMSITCTTAVTTLSWA